MQFHVWDDSWAEDPEFLSTVEKLKDGGWIRYFGLSLNRWEPENGLKALHTGVVDVVQVIYNIFDQAPEDKLLPICQELNVGVIARVPLDEGSLGGKMTLETRFPKDDWRSLYFGTGKSGEHDSARRQVEEDRACRHDAARNVPAFHSLSSGGQHHDRRHARPETRAAEHCRQ